MLRSWLEQIRVAIRPNGIDAVAIRRGDNKILRRETVNLDAETGWQQSLSHLPGTLAKLGAKGRKIRIVLSNTLTSFTILPWQEALAGESEWQAFARSKLVEVYGEQAASWHIQLAAQGYRKPVVACAVDGELATGLDAAIKEAGAHVNGIVPLFSAGYDQFSQQIKNRTYWLAQIEPGCLCLARIDAGRLSYLTSRRIAAESDSALGKLLAREIERSGFTEKNPAVYLHATGALAMPATLPDGSRLIRIEHHLSVLPDSQNLSMVMC